MAHKHSYLGKWVMYYPISEDTDTVEFGTLSEIRAWANKMGVPSNAKLVYAGCGTHNIAFEWPKTDDELAAEHNNVTLLGQDI